MSKIVCDDCLEYMKKMKDNSVDLVLTDPPYGLKFMGKEWDVLPTVDVWREALRVLKPGAFAFIMCTPRQDSFLEMLLRIREAGFSIGQSSIYWAVAQGFPKAHNISKAIDKRGGKYLDPNGFSEYIRQRRKVKGISLKMLNEHFGYVAGCNWWEAKGNNFRTLNNEDYVELKRFLDLDDRYDHLVGLVGEIVGEKIRSTAGFSNEQVPRPWKARVGEIISLTAPASPEAVMFEGWFGGFQPKPAVEIIIVAMKPMSEKTYAAQALKSLEDKHVGCGCLNMGAARIPIMEGDKCVGGAMGANTSQDSVQFATGYDGTQKTNSKGRFPANIICGSSLDFNLPMLIDAWAALDGDGNPDMPPNPYLTNGTASDALLHTLAYLGLTLEQFLQMDNRQIEARVKAAGDVLNDGRVLTARPAKDALNGTGSGDGKRKGLFQNNSLAVCGYPDSGSFSRYFSLDQWFAERIKQLPDGVQRTFPFLICPKPSKREKSAGVQPQYRLIDDVPPKILEEIKEALNAQA